MLSIFYSALSFTLNNIIKEKSIIQSRMSRGTASSISDTIRAFRQILIYKFKKKELEIMNKRNTSTRIGMVQTLIATPRVILEGMVIISLLYY